MIYFNKEKLANLSSRAVVEFFQVLHAEEKLNNREFINVNSVVVEKGSSELMERACIKLTDRTNAHWELSMHYAKDWSCSNLSLRKLLFNAMPI